MAETAQAGAPGLDFSEKVVVIGGGILAAMALTVVNPVLPSIDKELAHTAFQSMLVKQLFGFTSLAMVVGAPLGAWLSQRMGMRRMLMIAALLYTLAGTAGLYLTSLELLLVSRLLVGATAASIQVMSLTLINIRCEGNERARWMGLHVAVATFCTLFIHPLSGFLGNIGWHWPFIEYFVGLILFAALAAGRDRAKPASAPAAAERRPEGSVLSWFPWHYLVLSFLIGAVTFMPTAYGPYLLKVQGGLSPGGIAAVLTAGALIGATTSFFYGRARRVISTQMSFAISFGLAAAGAGIAALAPYPLLLLGLALHGIGVAWFVPNIMTALGPKVAADHQARATGLIKMAHFLSAPTCIFLQDMIAGKFGPTGAMLVVAVIAFAVFIAALYRVITVGKAQAVAAA